MTIDFDYKGYRIRQASATGGKAGKGHNRTSSVSVTPINFSPGNYQHTTIRFTKFDSASLTEAIKKARAWVDARTPTPSTETK